MPDMEGLPDYEPDVDFSDLDLSAAEGIPSSKAERAKRKLNAMDREDEKRKQPPSGKGSKSGKGGGSSGGKWSNDDHGNADFLVSEYGDDMRWDMSISEWVIWRGTRWEVDSAEAIRRAMSISRKFLKQADSILARDPEDEYGKFLRNWGHQSGNLSRIRSMLELAKSMPDMSLPGDKFNSDRRLIACPNGVLVLSKEGVSFRKARKNDFITRVTGCDFVDGYKSAMFDDFLDRFLPDEELRHWAQKVAGYSIIGGNPKRRIVFCWGPTSSGKSTFAELIRVAMGTYAGPFNLSMMRENPDERPRPDLVHAMPQRIVFASEASSDWRLHADMIKRATGQDPLLARLPHSGEGITMVPHFTPWIITNNIPTINGADQALYRRLCTVLFPNTIQDTEENEDFRSELVERGELPAVLAWLVDGWQMYCDEGISDPPSQIANAEIRMREQFSDLDVFLTECCDQGGPDYTEVPSNLYAAYEDWADTNGIKGKERLTSTAFGRALTGRGFKQKTVKVDGKTPRRRIGLRLKKSAVGGDS